MQTAPENSPCFCQSAKAFLQCCEPYLSARATPKSAEQLMRSRYSAFATKNSAYIQATMTGPALKNFDALSLSDFLEQTSFQSLELLASEQLSDTKATVSFKVYYEQQGVLNNFSETSLFVKQNQRWLYYDAL